MISNKENLYLTKTIFTEALIESSSDFIVVLYDLCEMTDPKLRLYVDPIYKWEYANWHNNWSDNVNFIYKKMVDLSPFDYDEIYESYTKIIEFFVTDESVSKIFDLSVIDHVGWKIFKELEEKRISAKKLKNILLMKETI